MRLCMGCGYEALVGDDWMRVDLDPDTKPDHLGDVRFLQGLQREYFEHIRAVDVLEHLSYRDLEPTMCRWAALLQPGGTMYLQVPAADEMIRRYTQTNAIPQAYTGEERRIMNLAWWLLGGHFDGTYTRDDQRWYLNAHHSLFDEPLIRWLAEQAGLEVERLQMNRHPNYMVWLRKP